MTALAGALRLLGWALRPWRRVQLLLAATLMVSMSACAPSNDISTNSINRALNEGGSSVHRQMRGEEKDQILALASSLPVCIAYRIPEKQNDPTGRLTSTIRAVSRELTAHSLSVGSVTLVQARRSGHDEFIGDDITAITGTFKHSFPNAPVVFEPVAQRDFRNVAVCSAKSTLLLMDDSISSYRTFLPTISVAGGALPDASLPYVLFIRLDGAPVRTAGSAP